MTTRPDSTTIALASEVACQRYNWKPTTGTVDDRGQLFIGSSYAATFQGDAIVFDRNTGQGSLAMTLDELFR